LKLLVYNVNCRNADRDAALDAIAGVDADVALLQEIAGEWPAALEARLAAIYPHRIVHLAERAPGGLAVLSKLPIDDDRVIPAPPDGWFPAQRVVVGGMQILHVHLRPALDERGWATGYVSTPPLRLRQIQTYVAELTPDPPVIVAGDYNEEPAGTTVAFLASCGLSRVVPTGPRTWRYVRDDREHLALDIDHVMIDPRLAASDARVIDAGSSDHRPIVVEIVRQA
jgi:endonuclease/exonuclease/phosphatase (EEP) superfamily protein YafD